MSNSKLGDFLVRMNSYDKCICDEADQIESEDKVDELFKWTYRNLFSTTLGAVIRDDINDIRSYLVKVISRNATADYGPNPLNDWRRI